MFNVPDFLEILFIFMTCIIFHDLEMINFGVFNNFNEFLSSNGSMTVQEKHLQTSAFFIANYTIASLQMTWEMNRLNIHQNIRWHKWTVNQQKTTLLWICVVFTINTPGWIIIAASVFNSQHQHVSYFKQSLWSANRQNHEPRTQKKSKTNCPSVSQNISYSSLYLLKKTFQHCNSDHFVQSHHRWQNICTAIKSSTLNWSEPTRSVKM